MLFKKENAVTEQEVLAELIAKFAENSDICEDCPARRTYCFPSKVCKVCKWRSSVAHEAHDHKQVACLRNCADKCSVYLQCASRILIYAHAEAAKTWTGEQRFAHQRKIFPFPPPEKQKKNGDGEA